MNNIEYLGYHEAFKPLVTENVLFTDEHMARFESVFNEAPVLHGFSWGEGLENMAEFLEKDNIPAVRDRVDAFLSKAGMNNQLESALLLPAADGTNIMEITDEMIKNNHTNEELYARANFIFTTFPDIPLLAKPADCPVLMVYAETKEGKPLVGLVHAGRTEVDRRLPLAAMLYLQKEMGCDPKEIRVGIGPSIAPEHYFIQEEDNSLLLNKDEWKDNLKHADGKIYLDLLHATVDQMQHAGLDEEHVEVYEIDTYAAATIGEGFSHRWATETNQPDKNGRFLVTIQIKN